MVNLDLTKLWHKNLKDKFVKLPKKGKKREALDYLYENLGKFIHIDIIKKHVSTKFKLTGTDPLQIRHLSTQDGWNIIKSGKYFHCLLDVDNISKSFIPNKRNILITNLEWNNLKKEYDFMCVNCGSKENEPMRWDKTLITKLQMGHMNPNISLTENNCIPQCEFCNRRYKNNVIFDKRGQILKCLKDSY